MKKRIIVVLVAVSMALFGSLAFAGDDWQNGFAKALDENNLAGAMMLAHNSQASPQAVHEALDAFGVGQEEVKESMLLAAEGSDDLDCERWCEIFNENCPPASPSAPPDFMCNIICSRCKHSGFCDQCP